MTTNVAGPIVVDAVVRASIAVAVMIVTDRARGVDVRRPPVVRAVHPSPEFEEAALEVPPAHAPPMGPPKKWT